MTRPLDESANARPLATEDEFRLHKPISRASTLGISTTSPRLHQPQSTLQRAHTVTQSNPVRRTGRTLLDREKKLQQTPSSLLRVKASNEGLSNRPLAFEVTSTARRDNNFAVANVGNNGKLYLRYETLVFLYYFKPMLQFLGWRGLLDM